MILLHSPQQNRLLAALSKTELGTFVQQLELVPMLLGDVVYESSRQMQHAYFPTTSIVSLQYVTQSGASCETSGVGNEGVVGISLFMGGNTTPSSAVVQTAGHAYRLQRHRLKEHFVSEPGLRRLLLRYTLALMAQMSLTAACNRHHSIDQQLCRLLLISLDRIRTGELVMTQELIAGLLGVRREGITDAAGNLQKAGLISYRRGHISIVDRVGLESRSCECYSVVRTEMTALLKS